MSLGEMTTPSVSGYKISSTKANGMATVDITFFNMGDQDHDQIVQEMLDWMTSRPDLFRDPIAQKFFQCQADFEPTPPPEEPPVEEPPTEPPTEEEPPPTGTDQ